MNDIIKNDNIKVNYGIIHFDAAQREFMKKYLLPKDGFFYKANLHSHSTVSDGRNTPEEMKNYYKAHGYHILALTDHELLVDHSDLNDADFLMLPGYEYAFVEREQWKYARTVEINLYPKEPGNLTQVCFNPKNVIHGEKWRSATTPYHGEIYERSLTVESIQHVVDEALAHGFIVGMNHPSYSMVTPEFFGKIKGFFALEIHNQGSYYQTSEYNTQMYAQLLRMGHRISSLASDDNHIAYVYDDKDDPRPWGFTMVKAKALTHKDIIAAMEHGDTYSTQGPLIHDLYIEDGVVHIGCDDVKTIIMHTKGRAYQLKTAPVKEFINEADFNIPDDEYLWFEIIDQYGRRANTRAYFLK